ncbi:hypothetical protein PIROE2DRAFT_8007 [Piromyces sp. E2]|nr:hypothetical protein PIROE2DRAFT_8007 [Piromyces sp. E2]|eukprot:OUM65032.1 hypothetical protein PIROE2DRAFT_8007 [Piromyces sp. E2]
MRSLYLLLSFLMVCTLQWGSHSFVNAKVPGNIYFPTNKGYPMGYNKNTGYSYLYVVEYTRSNAMAQYPVTGEKKLDEKYLVNGNTFTKVEINSINGMIVYQNFENGVEGTFVDRDLTVFKLITNSNSDNPVQFITNEITITRIV